jgi:Fur family transcriptional regulator, ferric uptake regulator
MIRAVVAGHRMETLDAERWSRNALGGLDRAGHRSGAAREAVVRLLAAQDCCLSAQEISDRLRASGERVGTASVYRALDLLHRNGMLHRVQLGDAEARYEPRVPGGEHHHHVVCDRCGRIVPFEDPALERAIDRLGGRLRHRVSGHDVVIRGACERCAAGEVATKRS